VTAAQFVKDIAAITADAITIRINSRGDRRYKKEAVLWLLGIQHKVE
jgi:hypothetical protein